MKRRRLAKAPYTMAAVTLLSTKRVLGLSTPAKRLLLFCQSLWRPGLPIILPVRWTADQVQRRPETVSAAVAELLQAGLIERTREHAPPGTPGGSHASEYRLVHRRKSKYQANSPLDRTGVHAVLDHGDEVRQGYVKIVDGDLVHVLCHFTDAELEVIWVVNFRNHPRNKFGAISQEPTLKVADLRALLPEIPPRTLRHAVESLVKQGQLRLVEASSGRRSATVAPHGVTADGLPWARKKTKAETTGRYKDASNLPSSGY